MHLLDALQVLVLYAPEHFDAVATFTCYLADMVLAGGRPPASP